ncbi:MAG TPA: flippase [Gammaproteobacteria bacterium]|nr:flippase [Gammaproteobacteria bacterium]
MHLRALRKTLAADLRAGTERGRMMRSAGVTAGLKLGATLLAFGASLIYARALEPHGYGLYAYVIAWTALLTIPAGLGFSTYLIREGSKAPASLRWLRRWADKRVLLSGIAAGILLACAWFVPQAADARWLFIIAAPLPLLNNLSAVRRALLQARGRVARAQWPLLILGPALMLIALAILWVWRGRLYPIELVAAMTGAAIVPILVNHWQLHRSTRASGSQALEGARVRAALPFMWLGMLYLVNNRADLILLGTLRGAHDAGIYAVASRAAELVTFFLVAANMVLAPRIARLYHEGNLALLQRLLTAAVRRVFLFTLPIALVFIVAAHPLLYYLYGPAYAQGALALQILAGAQLLATSSGPRGVVLNMTGHEKLTAVGVTLSAALNIALNAALIPLFGVQGSAMATGISIVAFSLLLWYWVRRRVGVNPSALRW